MSQENVDLVVRLMHAALKRPRPDFETINALVHRDHVFVSLWATALGEAETKGAPGYKAFLEEMEDVMPWEGELGGAVDVAPDKVLAVWTLRTRAASTGIDTEQRIWNVCTITDGKLTRTETYADPADALEAVGLRESS